MAMRRRTREVPLATKRWFCLHRWRSVVARTTLALMLKQKEE
jgi:hypothetical protein